MEFAMSNRVLLGAVAVSSSLLWSTIGVLGQESGDSEADAILQSMSDFMDCLSAYSVRYDVDNEVVYQKGQKLMFSSSGHLVLEWPGKLLATREGALADVEFRFNGKTLTLYGKNLNAYFQGDVEGTIDDAIEYLMFDLGIHAPGADLLASDAYSLLMANTSEGVHVGEATLGGRKVHHLAYRTPHVDWQIWIQADGDPLPLKYVITSKWVTAAPQYAVRLSDWNVSPAVAEVEFDFAPPEGARELETLEVDQMGNIVVEGEG